MPIRNGLSIVLLLVQLPLCSVAAETERVEFRREILPLLSDRCFQCHGPDSAAREADLRLDDRSVAVDELGVIVPGDPDSSELIRRINSPDPSEVMPPPDAHKEPLTAANRQKIAVWIRAGAEYQPHWAFVPPVRPELPEVNDADWIREPIDRLVLSRIEAEGQSPSPTADRYMLIRRLFLDLTGLPPRAEEVQSFVKDDDPQAYQRLVEILLDSPHFGERMALAWLDAARYADTNGYSIDGGRHMWLWRDWVIDAFNRNMPYDQFLVKQLAGDLLPDTSDSDLIATGFQRNNMVTHEGGTIPAENLTNYNADRVKTLGEAILGLTLGCAQCHDHKFDPITQRDYYRLFAYFNTLSDKGLDGNSGINPGPSFQTKTVLQTDELPKLSSQIDKLKQELAHPKPDGVAHWEAQQREALANRGRDFELHPLRLLKVSTPNSGAGFEIENNRYVHISQPSGLVAYDVSMELPELHELITGVRVVFHTSPDTPGAGLGFGTLQAQVPEIQDKMQDTFMLTSFSISADAVPGDQVNLSRLLSARQVTASSWFAEHRPEEVLDTRNESGWAPNPAERETTQITLTFDQPVDTAQLPFMTAQLNFGHGENLIATRFEIFAMTGVDDDSNLPADVIGILQTPQAARTPDQQRRLADYYAGHSADTSRQRVALANLEERTRVLTQAFPTMVMNVAEQPRETHILTRGNYAQPGEKVGPGTPAVLPPPPADAPPNRLGLAEWITMRGNPLTARVAVNRIWQMFFGTGIVKSAADFGAQGEYPTNPELLDWLAVEFMDSGWDVKSLVRTIVNSATYRQDSASRPAQLEHDPANQLLARGPRFRLPAEFIRDGALKVSGLLVDRLGGPSVNPYTPGDLWREVSHYGSTPATSQTFVQDHGEKLYRRSLYTYWKRTVPPPNMVAFDAPNRETCVVSRSATNTPLQALVLLNDVQFIEAARAFAERIIHHTAGDLERIQWAFLECLSRPPSAEESAVLMHALERERQRYAADEAAAWEYLNNGESLRDENIPVDEHAAWAQVASTLLNLSETVTRN